MKYCTKCGTQLHDEAVICPTCGCATGVQLPNYAKHSSDVSGLKIAAKILMIISCVITGFYLIPLCWTIPMTVHYCKYLKKRKHVGTGFKICTMLFVNFIAGIFMLCDDSDTDISNPDEDMEVVYIRQWKQLMDEGIISEEEYEKKRLQLLNIPSETVKPEETIAYTPKQTESPKVAHAPETAPEKPKAASAPKPTERPKVAHAPEATEKPVAARAPGTAKKPIVNSDSYDINDPYND